MLNGIIEINTLFNSIIESSGLFWWLIIKLIVLKLRSIASHAKSSALIKDIKLLLLPNIISGAFIILQVMLSLNRSFLIDLR